MNAKPFQQNDPTFVGPLGRQRRVPLGRQRPHESDRAVDEELTAYLDQELSPAEKNRVEQRLASDADYRRRMHELQKAWEMLDWAPPTEVSGEFTHTTVEMVAVKVAGDVQKTEAAQIRRRRLGVMSGVMVLLIVGLIGFIVGAVITRKPNQRLIEDLPLVADLDLYLETQSFEFVEALKDEELFTKPMEEAGDSDRNADPKWNGAATTSTGAADTFPQGLSKQQRKAKVAGMPAVEKKELHHKQQRLAALPQQEQVQLRRLERDITSSPNAAELLVLMKNYHEWLKTLTSRERSTVREGKPEKRVEVVKQILQQQESQRFKQLMAGRLSDRDRMIIFRYLNRFVDQHEEEILRALPPMIRDRITAGPLAAQGARRKPRLRRNRLMVSYYHRRMAPQMPRPSTTEVAQLVKMLSTEAQETLKSVTDPQEKLQTVQRWIWTALASRIAPRLSERALVEFWRDKLTVAERERLERLPPEQMHRELRRKLIERRGRLGPLGRQQPGPLGRQRPGPLGREQPRLRDIREQNRRQDGQRENAL